MQVGVPRTRLEWAKRTLEQQHLRSILTHYKGHPFTVEVDLFNLCLYIDHPLMPEDRRMIVFFKDNDPEDRMLVRKAGEILERLNIPRKAMEDFAVYDDAELLDLDAAFRK